MSVTPPAYELQVSRDGARWRTTATGPELAWLQRRGRALAGRLWLRKQGRQHTACAVRVVDRDGRILWAYLRGEAGQTEELTQRPLEEGAEAPCRFCGGYGWRSMPEESCPACDGVGTVPALEGVR